jgi:hypothetical protein
MDSDTYAEGGLYETREPNPARLELLDFLLAAADRRLELMRPASTPPSADILDASIGS